MHFPVAGIDLNPLIPPAVAFAISFFTSMGGVSGAFLLLPFQVSVLGFTSPAVSATNHLFNVVATPGGVWRYSREGRMVWPLAWIIILGTLPGVLVGALLRVYVLNRSQALQAVRRPRPPLTGHAAGAVAERDPAERRRQQVHDALRDRHHAVGHGPVRK